MEITVISEKANPLLKRKEVHFQVRHNKSGETPRRLDVRKALADALKTKVELVFIKKVETKTGTRTAIGVANVYSTFEQAKLIEPEYIIKRNIPKEERSEEGE